jgi:hypothetical protein
MDTPPVMQSTGIVTSDQIGEGDGKTYGADIGPAGGQDMWAFDAIAGIFPPQERSASAASFTGGMGGEGLGGQAEPLPPEGITPTAGIPGTVYQRRGF